MREKALELLEGVPFSETAEDSAKSILSFVVVEDDIFDLLPLHFVTERGSGGDVSEEQLFWLCVAGKMLYAQVRWLDAILDDYKSFSDRSLLYSINESLTETIQSIFSETLGRELSPNILCTLSYSYARYSLSVALDAASSDPGNLAAQYATLDDYVVQARARAAPVCAPVDAVLLLQGAPEYARERARNSFEAFAVGAQLYDDALDLEEDFGENRPTWLVCETLREMKSRKTRPTNGEDITDLFYETALLGGLLSKNLDRSERFFGIARRLSEPLFARCARRSAQLISRVRALRKDYEEMNSSYYDSTF